MLLEIEQTTPRTQGLLSMKESLEHLRQRYPHLPMDTLYHRATRGSGIPHIRTAEGYFFERQDLDAVEFYKQRERPRSTTRLPYIQPVSVHSAEDLRVLQEQFGELIDDDALLALLEEKFQHRYTPGAIKRRRQRHTIVCVGYSGKGVHWYPVDQLEHLNFQPELARRQKARHAK